MHYGATALPSVNPVPIHPFVEMVDALWCHSPADVEALGSEPAGVTHSPIPSSHAPACNPT